jgi:hypothetical protein
MRKIPRVTAGRECWNLGARDVHRIQITKVYTSCPGWSSGGRKSTPVKHKHMLFPPACSSPLIAEDLPGSWPGRYMKMDSPKQNSLVPQFVWYHSLSGTICLCLQACNVLLYKLGQATWRVGSKVYVCNVFGRFCRDSVHSMCCPDHSREKKQWYTFLKIWHKRKKLSLSTSHLYS